MASCYHCKAKPAKGWSAYCEGCQPVSSDPPLTGNACLCRKCGQVFTSITAFDLHRESVDGVAVCLNAATATRRNGKPVFTAYRALADGTPVHGKYTEGGKPGWYLEAVSEKISRPNGVPDVSSEGEAA